jgi:hypothetical protein
VAKKSKPITAPRLAASRDGFAANLVLLAHRRAATWPDGIMQRLAMLAGRLSGRLHATAPDSG